MASALVMIYVKKIKSGAINPETGEPWKLEDVPIRWREAVREELEKEDEPTNDEEPDADV